MGSVKVITRQEQNLIDFNHAKRITPGYLLSDKVHSDMTDTLVMSNQFSESFDNNWYALYPMIERAKTIDDKTRVARGQEI